MREDEAAESRDFDGAVHCRVLVVGNAEQSQRGGLHGVVASLDRREFGRLVFQRIEPVLIAEKHLQRHENDQEVERHAHHHARVLGGSAAAQQPSADAQHDEARW